MSSRASAVLFLAVFLSALAAQALAADVVDPVVLAKVRDTALQSNWGYQRLADLTDKIGARLTGSPQAEAAVQQVAAAMRREGLVVRLEPATVPHWVRGEERAELVAFPGKTAFNQRVVLTTLGGSSSTGPEGMRGEILIVKNFDELKSKAASVPGKIVLFDMPYDTHLSDNGYALEAYRQSGAARFQGPSAAAKLGASAVLVRSISGAMYRMPHTGATSWAEGVKPIPAAAIAAEDAELIGRLAVNGPVTVQLTLTPQTLPDVESANVIAELPGTDLKDEVVLVSGHLDSWDLATGAVDDGAGVAAAMGAVQVIQSLHLKPRRTIRFVAWMNEENGGRGAKAYAAAHKEEFARHVAVIESDDGGGRALGFIAYAKPESAKLLEPVTHTLDAIGAGFVDYKAHGVGSDLGAPEAAGVPGFDPLLDMQNYFDYHHTPADTLDKVNPDDMKRHVAVLATLVYFLADSPQTLERMPVKPQ